MANPPKKGPQTAPQTGTVTVLGFTFTESKVKAARAAIAKDIGIGYNHAKPDEPGYWTWEGLGTRVYGALGLDFKSTDTARETGRLAGNALRGVYRNGSANWKNVKPDAETIGNVLGFMVAAYGLHVPRSES